MHMRRCSHGDILQPLLDVVVTCLGGHGQSRVEVQMSLYTSVSVLMYCLGLPLGSGWPRSPAHRPLLRWNFACPDRACKMVTTARSSFPAFPNPDIRPSASVSRERTSSYRPYDPALVNSLVLPPNLHCDTYSCCSNEAVMALPKCRIVKRQRGLSDRKTSKYSHSPDPTALSDALGSREPFNNPLACLLLPTCISTPRQGPYGR